MRKIAKNGWWVLLGFTTILAAIPGWSQSDSSPSRYVDHDTAVKMGSVGNYVSQNELRAYQDRVDLQSSLKQQLAGPEKTVSLPSDQTVVFFNRGQARLTPEGKTEVGRIAEQIKDDPSLVAVVDGYTDNTGPENISQKLSQERANAVKGELLKLGVSERQVRTQGFGPSQPIASNANDEGRAMNRRAEIYVENFKETIG